MSAITTLPLVTASLILGPVGALPRCMRPEPVPCLAPDPWRSNHSITRPCVSERGPSNGQVSAHVDPQTKPVCDLSHLDGTIFFALRGGLTYINPMTKTLIG